MKVCSVQDSEGSFHGYSAARNRCNLKMSKQKQNQKVAQEKDAESLNLLYDKWRVNVVLYYWITFRKAS